MTTGLASVIVRSHVHPDKSYQEVFLLWQQIHEGACHATWAYRRRYVLM